VLLARVDGSLLSPAASGLDEGALERREIERRELYVGMTRARDGLWVGSQ
jgi:superfamily I DNA/RNA helicase